MTTYYVDYVNGNDSNNGLGPDASHASNKPWKTVTKLLGASGMASGDTAYLSPAGAFRETVTVAMTGPAAETRIIGDPLNQQQFKDGSGVLLAPGEVVITAYTTNDATLPAAASTIDLAGRDNLTFEYITFYGGRTDPSCIGAYTAHSRSIVFRRCAFYGTSSGPEIGYLSTANEAGNWTIDRCVFLQSYYYNIYLALAQSGSADYDSNMQITSCLVIGGGDNFVVVDKNGSNTFFGGGVDMFNCTVLSGEIMRCQTGVSTSIPCTVTNSVCVNGSNNCLVAATSGQITENYNLLYSPIPRSNVTAGANSTSDFSKAPMFSILQEWLDLFQPRPLGMPLASSPLIAGGTATGAPTTDLFSQTRPGTPAVGALERNTLAQRIIRADTAGGMRG